MSQCNRRDVDHIDVLNIFSYSTPWTFPRLVRLEAAGDCSDCLPWYHSTGAMVAILFECCTGGKGELGHLRLELGGLAGLAAFASAQEKCQSQNRHKLLPTSAARAPWKEEHPSAWTRLQYEGRGDFLTMGRNSIVDTVFLYLLRLSLLLHLSFSFGKVENVDLKTC